MLLWPLMALVLATCAPTTMPMGTRLAVPALVGDVFRTADGRALPMRSWRLEGNAAPRAVILALHGFNDHSAAFDVPGRWWATRGVATYAYDQRGFGMAEPRGVWPGAATLVADMRDAASAVRARHPGVPLYLLGESMGGAVLLTALAERGLPPGVSGAVLSAPAVWSRDTMPFYQRWALAMASWTVPWLELTAPRGLKIQASDNIEMLRALGRDPLVIKATRVDAMRGLTDLMDAAMERSADLRAPSLVLYGANEQVIPEPARERALSRIPLTADGSGPRIVLYPQGWHLLLRDLQAETVWADILAWIADPAGPLPSGAERKRQQAATAVPSH